MQLTLEWPFFGLQDENGSRVPYVCLQGPVGTAAEVSALQELSRCSAIIGFTSYLTFPAGTHPVNGPDYGTCVAWCHCFREPEKYLPRDKPALLGPFSDFVDYSRARPESYVCRGKPEKQWDFAYVCQAGQWKEYVKNWELAGRCLPVLCHDLRLRGVLIGRDQIPDLPDCSGRITIFGEIPWHELMSVFERSRFLFVPNMMDASPRIIAEALCMNTPVLVNRNILGGWHYVNPFTGFFFEDEDDVAVGARRSLSEWTSPRRWFRAHHGPLLAGERLGRFLGEFDPAMRRVKRVQIKLGRIESRTPVQRRAEVA
jgi:glycosyltransferase involved in cell wall biosynthesis